MKLAVIIIVCILLLTLNYVYPYEEFVGEEQKRELDKEFDKATYLKKVIIETC